MPSRVETGSTPVENTGATEFADEVDPDREPEVDPDPIETEPPAPETDPHILRLEDFAGSDAADRLARVAGTLDEKWRAAYDQMLAEGKTKFRQPSPADNANGNEAYLWIELLDEGTPDARLVWRLKLTEPATEGEYKVDYEQRGGEYGYRAESIEGEESWVPLREVLTGDELAAYDTMLESGEANYRVPRPDSDTEIELCFWEVDLENGTAKIIMVPREEEQLAEYDSASDNNDEPASTHTDYSTDNAGVNNLDNSDTGNPKLAMATSNEDHPDDGDDGNYTTPINPAPAYQSAATSATPALSQAAPETTSWLPRQLEASPTAPPPPEAPTWAVRAAANLTPAAPLPITEPAPAAPHPEAAHYPDVFHHLDADVSNAPDDSYNPNPLTQHQVVAPENASSPDPATRTVLTKPTTSITAAESAASIAPANLAPALKTEASGRFQPSTPAAPGPEPGSGPRPEAFNPTRATRPSSSQAETAQPMRTKTPVATENQTAPDETVSEHTTESPAKQASSATAESSANRPAKMEANDSPAESLPALSTEAAATAWSETLATAQTETSIVAAPSLKTTHTEIGAAQANADAPTPPKAEATIATAVIQKPAREIEVPAPAIVHEAAVTHSSSSTPAESAVAQTVEPGPNHADTNINALAGPATAESAPILVAASAPSPKLRFGNPTQGKTTATPAISEPRMFEPPAAAVAALEVSHKAAPLEIQIAETQTAPTAAKTPPTIVTPTFTDWLTDFAAPAARAAKTQNATIPNMNHTSATIETAAPPSPRSQAAPAELSAAPQPPANRHEFAPAPGSGLHAAAPPATPPATGDIIIPITAASSARRRTAPAGQTTRTAV